MHTDYYSKTQPGNQSKTSSKPQTSTSNAFNVIDISDDDDIFELISPLNSTEKVAAETYPLSGKKILQFLYQS